MPPKNTVRFTIGWLFKFSSILISFVTPVYNKPNYDLIKIIVLLKKHKHGPSAESVFFFSFYNIKSDAFNVKIWQLCSATVIFSPFQVVDDSNIGLQNFLGLRQRE